MAKKIHQTTISHEKKRIPFTNWQIAAFVLALLLIISVFTNGFSFQKKLSKEEVKDKAEAYINALMKGQATAAIQEITEENDLYRIKLDVGGRVYDSYVSKDGQLLFPQAMNMTQELPAEQPPAEQADLSNVDMTDDDPAKGNDNAPVTIVEFSDFQCPFCAKFYTQTLPQIEEEYIKTGKARLVYRDFPLDSHKNSQKAAEASECADDQGKFWEMHNIMFDNQDSIGVSSLKKYAENIGLDTAKFNECLDSGKYQAEVQKDLADGQKYGVTGTPAFFINGRLVSGAQPFDVFKGIIDEELSK